jgi:hypothetical protein
VARRDLPMILPGTERRDLVFAEMLSARRGLRAG